MCELAEEDYTIETSFLPAAMFTSITQVNSGVTSLTKLEKTFLLKAVYDNIR